MPVGHLFFTFIFLAMTAMPAMAQDHPDTTYSRTEIGVAVEDFFQDTAGGLADLVQRAFEEQGRPNGYIKGNEASGAFVAGLRYGEGYLYMKNHPPVKVYWQGPSLGFDFGGNASKVFTLVYDLPEPDALFKRYAGVDGSAYLVGGFSMNYQERGDVILAPIRTGVGLRLGANVGYLEYTRKSEISPF